MDNHDTETNPFDALFAEAEKTDAYWISKAKFHFTEEMLAMMKMAEMSKSQLAEKLGAKPAFVTRLCSGTNNFTLETMVRIARALNCELRSHLQPEGQTTHWIDVLKAEPVREGCAEHIEWPAFTVQLSERSSVLSERGPSNGICTAA
jgi:transcriptional regulator with XRE-family HTH domain